MMRHGLAYGLLSTRRRIRTMVLPVVTTATGAFLVVQVLSLTGAISSQAAQLGNGAELRRAVVLIAVVVLLVGVVEVAVCTTRTIATRTREIGVLGATGVGRTPVVAALLVEPFAAAVVGATAGAFLAVVSNVVLTLTSITDAQVSVGGTVLGVVVAITVSGVAALATSAVPSWRAASRPPIRSLTS